MTERQRSLQLQRLLEEIIFDHDEEIILLDNIEIIFDLSLHQDPLRLLQRISRNKTVVAAWNGTIDGDFLTYAAPAYIEYRRYPIRDLLIVTPEGKI